MEFVEKVESPSFRKFSDGDPGPEAYDMAQHYARYKIAHGSNPESVNELCNYILSRFKDDTCIRVFDAMLKTLVKEEVRNTYGKLIQNYRKEACIELGIDEDYNKHWFMITVNYPPDYNVQQLEGNVKKIKTISSIDSIIGYIHEFHTEQGNHPHTHMLVRTKLPKSKVIQYVAQKLKVNQPCVDVKGPKDGTRTFDTAKAYVEGRKTDKKMQNVEKDDEFRKLINENS